MHTIHNVFHSYIDIIVDVYGTHSCSDICHVQILGIIETVEEFI